MTIDEAIENLKYDKEIDMYIRDIAPKIAEWLEELKQLRIEKEKKCDECTYFVTVEEAFTKGYQESIDDFVNACEQDIMCQRFGLRILDTKKIAERLKERSDK